MSLYKTESKINESKRIKKSITHFIFGAIIVFIVIGVISAIGHFFASSFNKPTELKEHQSQVESEAHSPIFLTLETFTVKLKPDPNDKFLQLDIQLQVPNTDVEVLLNTQMPVVRNRLLILLSGKTGSEIDTPEGKKALTEEILTELKKPFTAGGIPNEILGVFFTSFIVQ